MYEGQTLICQNLIEDNWLEFLSFIKKQSDEEFERNKKRMSKLAELDDAPDLYPGSLATEPQKMPDGYRYYDVSVNTFWNWYITHKV
jgi:hypothetical protein